MADRDLWTIFEKSGRIEDYLSYKGIYLEDNDTCRKAEEKVIESKCNCDRNDTVYNTYW